MDFSGCKDEDNLMIKRNGFGSKRKESVGDVNQPKKLRVHATESGTLTWGPDYEPQLVSHYELVVLLAIDGPTTTYFNSEYHLFILGVRISCISSLPKQVLVQIYLTDKVHVSKEVKIPCPVPFWTPNSSAVTVKIWKGCERMRQWSPLFAKGLDDQVFLPLPCLVFLLFCCVPTKMLVL